jgi:carbon storage regulator
MLVLTRRAGQALLIGGSIEVRVVRIDGDRVVLGVVAPREVAVVRDELAAEVTLETRAAADAVSHVRTVLRRGG